MEAEADRKTPYEQLGGEPGVAALVEAFYARVEDDPLLRPIYPRHLGCAKRNLAHFLVEFLGGPPEHSENRGTSLRFGHAHLQIGEAEQQAWLVDMRGALADLGVEESLREVLEDVFAEASRSLVNLPSPTSSNLASAREAEKSFAPGADLEAEFAWRWSRQQALEELRIACEAGEMARAQALSDLPVLAEHLPAQYTVVALAGTSGKPELLEWARARLERLPGLLLARGNYGGTLLQTAAGVWSTPFVELLLADGGDPNVDSLLGDPPLCAAANRTITTRSPNRDQAQPVVTALVQAGAEINAAGGVKQTTPLHNAARRGTVEMAAALLHHGAELEARDSNGESPLRRAVNCGKPEVVALLLERGANPHSRSHDGTTPCDAARTPAVRGILRPWLEGSCAAR